MQKFTHLENIRIGLTDELKILFNVRLRLRHSLRQFQVLT